MSAVEEVDGTGLRDLVQKEKRGVLVDFWSPWCAPCRVLRPHLDRLAGERTAGWRFVAVNIEEHPAAADTFGVASRPTVVLFNGGEEVYRFSGAALVSALDAKLDELSGSA